MFRTPENKKIRITFFSAHYLWKYSYRFERKKTEKQRKSPESRLHAAIVPQYVRFSGLIGVWGSANPRGPNFAEIHARGRRGRLESDHRDLFPPWGHRLFHGEAGKPTMAVWHDRYDGVFPSWLTAVAGKGNCTTAAHSRTGFDSRQPIQWRCLQYAATEAGTAAHNRFTRGPSRSGDVYLDTGFPGETLSRLGPYPGCTGRRAAVSLAKRRRSDG